MPAISLPIGNSRWDVTIPADRLLPLKGDGLPRAPISDPRAAVREAMEHPFGLEFPLRKGLTPDDHITIVIDQMLPRLAELVSGVLDYVVASGIEPGSVTLLTSSSSHQGWVDDLPDEFADVRTEVHNPADRKRLSYLASTSDGRRLYLNRSLVDAEQSILLTGRGFDPVLGHSGAELLIYPILSDTDTRRAVVDRFGTEGADAAGVIRAEALEVAWLFGSPFLIQVIEGEGDTLTSIFAGLMNSTEEGVRRQDASWRRSVSQQADIVLATVSGSPLGQDFSTLARAARAVLPAVSKDGCIVVLSEVEPLLEGPVELLREYDEPAEAVQGLLQKKPDGGLPAVLWAGTASQSRLYLASGLKPEIVEELFATPIVSPREVQRLIDSGGMVLHVPDAHKTKLFVES